MISCGLDHAAEMHKTLIAKSGRDNPETQAKPTVPTMRWGLLPLKCPPPLKSSEITYGF